MQLVSCMCLFVYFFPLYKLEDACVLLESQKPQLLVWSCCRICWKLIADGTQLPSSELQSQLLPFRSEPVVTVHLSQGETAEMMKSTEVAFSGKVKSQWVFMWIFLLSVDKEGEFPTKCGAIHAYLFPDNVWDVLCTDGICHSRLVGGG